MPQFKKPRDPDEKTVHDVLDEAIARGDFDNLPNKGKPLNLSAYFAVHPDAQVSTQLLIDNKALPKSLQDRKEADDMLSEADGHLAGGEQALGRFRTQIAEAAEPVVNLFPDRETLMQSLSLHTWPPAFPAPTAEKAASRLPVRQIKRLRQLMHQHNRQAARIISEYASLLEQTNEKIRRINLDSMAGGPVTGGGKNLQRKILDVKALVADAESRIKPMPSLPEDTLDRIRSYLDKKNPSLWRRLIKK